MEYFSVGTYLYFYLIFPSLLLHYFVFHFLLGFARVCSYFHFCFVFACVEIIEVPEPEPEVLPPSDNQSSSSNGNGKSGKPDNFSTITVPSYQTSFLRQNDVTKVQMGLLIDNHAKFSSVILRHIFCKVRVKGKVTAPSP